MYLLVLSSNEESQYEPIGCQLWAGFGEETCIEVMVGGGSPAGSAKVLLFVNADSQQVVVSRGNTTGLTPFPTRGAETPPSDSPIWYTGHQVNLHSSLGFHNWPIVNAVTSSYLAIHNPLTERGLQIIQGYYLRLKYNFSKSGGGGSFY